MATADTDIDAEKPEERSNQQPILLGGQLDAENGLREVLDDIMVQGKNVPFGILKVLSKEVRGHIGIENGTTIFGAHVTTTSDYGINALKMLLGATRGLYTFVSSQKEPIELRQCLNISVHDLLVWRPPGSQPESRPQLADGVDLCATNTGEFDPLTEAALKEFVIDATDHDTALMAWGAGAPVLKSTLSNLLKDTSRRNTAEIEIVPVPTDFDELEQQITGRYKIPEMPMPPKPAPPRPQQQPPPPQQSSWADTTQPEPKPQAPEGATVANNWSADQLNAIPSPDNKVAPGSPERSTGTRHVSISSRMRASEDDNELDQMVTSQRMQAINPDQLVVSQRLQAGTARPVSRVQELELPTVLPDKYATTRMIIGGVAGFVMAMLLCRQVFEIFVSQSHFQTGLKKLANNDNTNAQIEFDVVLTNRGDFTRAYFYRALAETRGGKLDEALADFDRVITREPKNLMAYAGRASVRIKAKDYDSAIIDCDTMLQMQPKYGDAYRLRALAFSKSKRYKEAIDDATNYLENIKGDSPAGRADVLSTRAYAHFKLKKFEEALADYTSAIELNPKIGTLYASRAIVHRELHDWPHALSDADKASQIDPSDTSIFQLRGLCFKAMGDSEKALAELDRAVSLTPTVSMHKMRGEARLAVRDFSGALKDFDYVLSVTPEDKEAKVFYDRARLNVRGGPATATSVVADAVKSSSAESDETPAKISGSPVQLTNRGYELLKEGRGAEAVAILKAALRGDPNSTSARRYLAYALNEAGDYSGAILQFNVLQQLGPLQENDKQVLARATKKLQTQNAPAAPSVGQQTP